MCFTVMRQNFYTVQCTVIEADAVSRDMVSVYGRARLARLPLRAPRARHGGLCPERASLHSQTQSCVLTSRCLQVKFSQSITPESIVDVFGEVVKVRRGQLLAPLQRWPRGCAKFAALHCYNCCASAGGSGSLHPGQRRDRCAQGPTPQLSLSRPQTICLLCAHALVKLHVRFLNCTCARAARRCASCSCTW